MVWLALEGEEAPSRMGVTAEHPLFVAGHGFVPAGELQPGDMVRNADLGELRVASAELDTTPRLVRNLEVAGAHTYFAGDLGVWGHNAGVSASASGSACFENALRDALDFIESESGEPFRYGNSDPSKFGSGVTINGGSGTQLRIERDDRHGSHINATCRKSKKTFPFAGGLPGWAKRGGR